MPSIEVTHQSGHSLRARCRSVCVHRFNAAKTCDADASITALPERDCGERDNQVNTVLAPRSALSAKHEAPMKNRAKGHGGMESVATRGAAARGRVHGGMHGAQAWPHAWRASIKASERNDSCRVRRHARRSRSQAPAANPTRQHRRHGRRERARALDRPNNASRPQSDSASS